MRSKQIAINLIRTETYKMNWINFLASDILANVLAAKGIVDSISKFLGIQ